MKKIMLIISVITLFSACKKDFFVWKNYNEEKYEEYKKNLGNNGLLDLDTCWVSNSSRLLVEVIHFAQTKKMPKLSSVVTCKYSGFLVDGTRFEYSENSSFLVENTIKGWKEILCQMPQGSRFRIYVPYELGYGKEGRKGNTFVIPPYSTLIFNIEIIDVTNTP